MGLICVTGDVDSDAILGHSVYFKSEDITRICNLMIFCINSVVLINENQLNIVYFW